MKHFCVQVYNNNLKVVFGERKIIKRKKRENYDNGYCGTRIPKAISDNPPKMENVFYRIIKGNLSNSGSTISHSHSRY